MRIKIISFLFLSIFLFSSKSAEAQYYEDAIGLRAGTTFAISYKHFIYIPPLPRWQQYIEGMIGFHLDEQVFIGGKSTRLAFNTFVAECYYKVHKDIGFDTGWAGFAGLGLYGGIFTETSNTGVRGAYGGSASIGVEYTFRNLPINMGIDWNPRLGKPYSSLTRGNFTVRYLFPMW